MSHEIRTPLTAILGFSGLLEKIVDLPSAAKRYVSAVATAGHQLLGVVDDILDVSRLETGQITLDPQPLDPSAFVAETVDLLSALALAKGLDLRVELSPDLPAWVSIDAGRLRQVLLNLIGNAIKFTVAGAVTVTLRPAASQDSAHPGLSPGLSPRAVMTNEHRAWRQSGAGVEPFGGSALYLGIGQV